MDTVNNRETVSNDKAHYINHLGQIFNAVIKRITHHDGNHHAELDVDVNGQTETVEDVPYNTLPEAHSWNHVITAEHTEPKMPVVPPATTEATVEPVQLTEQVAQ